MKKQDFIRQSVVNAQAKLLDEPTKAKLVEFSKTLNVTSQSWKFYTASLQEIGLDFYNLPVLKNFQPQGITQIGKISQLTGYTNWKNKRAYGEHTHRDVEKLYIKLNTEPIEYNSEEEMMEDLGGNLTLNCEIVFEIQEYKYKQKNGVQGRINELLKNEKQFIFEKCGLKF